MLNARNVWDELAREANDGPVGPELVCIACTGPTGVSGARLTAMSEPLVRELVCATDMVGERLEELEMTLGEGPCSQAFGSGGPLLVPDLETADSVRRWPGFSAAATEAGVRAVFAFPVRAGTIQLGVLSLYRMDPGPLRGDELGNALVFAEAAAELLLDRAPGVARDKPAEGLAGYHAQVYQATGMVSVQLTVSAAEAFARLRAYAYSRNLSLSAVAGDVVGRRLRFGIDTGE